MLTLGLAECCKRQGDRLIVSESRLGDSTFAGGNLGIRAIIRSHGAAVAEIRSEFDSALDGCPAERKKQGVKPEKPASGRLLPRLTPKAQGKVIVVARAAGKSKTFRQS